MKGVFKVLVFLDFFPKAEWPASHEVVLQTQSHSKALAKAGER